MPIVHSHHSHHSGNRHNGSSHSRMSWTSKHNVAFRHQSEKPMQQNSKLLKIGIAGDHRQCTRIPSSIRSTVLETREDLSGGRSNLRQTTTAAQPVVDHGRLVGGVSVSPISIKTSLKLQKDNYKGSIPKATLTSKKDDKFEILHVQERRDSSETATDKNSTEEDDTGSFDDFLREHGLLYEGDPEFERYLEVSFPSTAVTSGAPMSSSTSSLRQHREWWKSGFFPRELTGHFEKMRHYPNIIVQAQWMEDRRHRDAEAGKIVKQTCQIGYPNEVFGPVRIPFDFVSGRFGKYKFHHMVGQGMSGKTYICLDEECTKLKAVKILPLAPYKSQISLCVLREILMLSCELVHPNLLQAECYMHLPKFIAIIKPCEYKDLRTYVRETVSQLQRDDTKERCPLPMIREICFAVLSALCFLHKNGIVHLHIAPENILIRLYVHPNDLSRRHVKVGDLGACVNGRKDGTPIIAPRSIPIKTCFWAPEAYTHPQRHDGRLVDVWSTGVLMMGMAYGLGRAWFNAYQALSGNPRKSDKIWAEIDHLQREHGSEGHMALILELLSVVEKRPLAHQALVHPWFCDKTVNTRKK